MIRRCALEAQQVHLTAKIEGVVLPTWVAIVLSLSAVVAAFTLLLVWTAIKEQTREVRILHVHTQDIQNVLIREGVATRADFISITPSKEEKERPDGP